MSSTKPSSFFPRDWPGPLYFLIGTTDGPGACLGYHVDASSAATFSTIHLAKRTALQFSNPQETCTPVMIPSPRFGESLHVAQQLFSVDFLKDVMKDLFFSHAPGATSKLWGTALPDGRPGPCVVGAWCRGDAIHSPKPARHHLFAQTPIVPLCYSQRVVCMRNLTKKDAWRKILIPHELSQC